MASIELLCYLMRDACGWNWSSMDGQDCPETFLLKEGIANDNVVISLMTT